MYTLGIDVFSSRRERSGVEWYTHHLLRAMEPATPPDWRVFLYSLDTFSNPKPQPPNLWQQKQLRWPPKRGWGQIRLSWEMFRRPPNVLFVPAAAIPLVHPHAPERKQWTVTTIHDAEFLHAPERYRPADRRRQEFALAIATTHAARIIVPSVATRVALGERVHDDKVAVIPLGVDHAHYRPITDREVISRVLAKYYITSPYILYVGRIDAKKNLATLIRAWQSLGGDTKLVLAGSRGFGADELPRDRVHMLGYVPEEDLPSLYCGAQVFVFPSQNEGFGLPVLAALACGVPTVIADTPALREVAGDAALVVQEDSKEMWSNALRRVLTDQSLRDTLRKRGLERAQQFSWERTARETWRVIENLVQ